MKKTVILFAVLMLSLAVTSIAERFNYKWKDADGVLNITDYPPPANVEIIEISVVPLPSKKQAAPEDMRQKEVQKQRESLKAMQREAASLRKEAAALRLNAANLIDEAQELRRLSKKQRFKSRYRLQASNKEREAEELIKKADLLDRKADDLEG